MMSLQGKQVTVAGLGKFGGNIAAARWLVEQGAKVLVSDQLPAEKLKSSIAQLEDLPIEWHLGEQTLGDFTGADLIVASPAIWPTNPLLLAAEKAGVPATTEIVLFVERCPAKIIAVTGTKGKSTTTALLGEMLKTKFTTHVGGNLGVSLLPILAKIAASDVVALELSSFMLHYLRRQRWSPHVAVVTMLAADHLDWHGTTENYLADKRGIVEHQSVGDYAVLNGEDEVCREWAEEANGKVVWFGMPGGMGSGLGDDSAVVGDVSQSNPHPNPPPDYREREMKAAPFKLMIPGAHNQLNAQAAFAAAHIFGISREAAQKAIKDFRGLPHRLALVHQANGVRYYDDSIATIPQAAIAAMSAFPRGKVIQIVGGYDKGLASGELCEALRKRAKAILCIGKTGERIADELQKDPKTPVHRCGELTKAMAIAKQIAAPGDVVLLSTGFASYDQFDNFQQRGKAFAELARQLAI